MGHPGVICQVYLVNDIGNGHPFPCIHPTLRREALDSIPIHTSLLNTSPMPTPALGGLGQPEKPPCSQVAFGGDGGLSRKSKSETSYAGLLLVALSFIESILHIYSHRRPIPPELTTPVRNNDINTYLSKGDTERDGRSEVQKDVGIDTSETSLNHDNYPSNLFPIQSIPPGYHPVPRVKRRCLGRRPGHHLDLNTCAHTRSTPHSRSRYLPLNPFSPVMPTPTRDHS
ncbi:hypothetical protein GGS23DRAFT_382129 [Durotheca rogersii]|uniref:uncharacterized protein n=1 Tax=Durotheca rogersii TaxID=419775 RepID=UPI00221F30E7|nr:uncharacterized protein GGS23DRAFT_382129 [Durotheca rogersii]KAI5866328.1 hypothetical protein GGS23DRAFT_382129 [Durotheca rogersii]